VRSSCRITGKNRPFGLLRNLSVSDIRIKPMAGFSAFIWSNLCTRHILSELTPRGHQYWPDKRYSPIWPHCGKEVVLGNWGSAWPLWPFRQVPQDPARQPKGLLLQCELRSWDLRYLGSAVKTKLWGRLERAALYGPQKHTESGVRSETVTIPELQQSKAVLNTLASPHSRRSYTFAIDRFIAWYCSEARSTFNRAVVVLYRSHLGNLRLSASTTNLHLSAIRPLADESAESGWLTSELAIGNPASSGRQTAWAEDRQLAYPEPGERVGECRLEDRPAGLAGWSNPRVTSGVWVATFRSRGTDTGPTANAGGTLGHRRSSRQGKAVANSTCAVMVQAAPGCMAPAFGREPGESL
jgi:hypothetical protein